MSIDIIVDHERSMERQRLGWSLAALTAMGAPHLLHTPAWLTLAAVALGTWRMLGAWRGWRQPGRRTRWLLGAAAMIGVLGTFRTINGVEAAAPLLLLLSMVKLMESKGLRDYFFVCVLAYFLGVANFLYDQTVPLALYMVPAVWLTTTALLNVAHPDGERSVWAGARSAGRLLLPALPVAAILFVLFPRMPGPLWGVGSFRHSGVTGLSPNMSPGEMSELAQSDAVAFRVKFDGQAPPRKLQYWRAMVLHDYDGRTWSTGNLPWMRSMHVTTRGSAIAYDVTLEPNNLATLYALDAPVEVPNDAGLSASLEIDTRTAIMERRLYHAVSYTDYSYGADMPKWMLHRDLALPDGDTRAKDLAQRWRNSASSPEQVVADAINMFHDQPFAYTLQPGTLNDRNQIDQFLFDRRRGFCEHYAGAFVFLMRAAGIPAHVVIGYQGGDLNPLDGYYMVRQQDAHAWAEIWLQDRGWVRVDPTAAVDPARVENGVDAALPADELTMFSTHPWLLDLRHSWDAVNTAWDEGILAYGPELQEKVFSRLGLEYGNWIQLAVVLLLLVGACMGAFWAYLAWEKRSPRQPKVVREYARFCRRLTARGLPRLPHEGPLDYATRVAKQRPDLEEPLMEITAAYIELRYIERGDLQHFTRLVRAFKPVQSSR